LCAKVAFFLLVPSHSCLCEILAFSAHIVLLCHIYGCGQALWRVLCLLGRG
jgi:hypothetical protein